MAKKIINKKVLAALMAAILVFSQVRMITLAAADEAPELVKNYAHTYYNQDGSAGTESDWFIHLGKEAAATEQENVFDITLTIETKNTQVQLGGKKDGAVALILDVSNSMNKIRCTHCGQDAEDHHNFKGMGYRCNECGKGRSEHHTCVPEANTPLASLKKAVKDFLDTYVADAVPGDQRLISIVEFYTNAKTVQGWIDVNNAQNMAAVKAAVDNLTATHYSGKNDIGGTNMEAGLVLGRNLLKAAALDEIPVGNQNLILFSDGQPTAKVKDVNSTSTTQVSYGGNDVGTKTDREDYDDIPGILNAISAHKIAVKYSYDDSDGVLASFDKVLEANNGVSLSVVLTGQAGESVEIVTNASTVTDPMGLHVSLVGAPAGYNFFTQTWDLRTFTRTEQNGVATYTRTYQVILDPTNLAEDAQLEGYTVFTPANGATVLNYTVGDDDSVLTVDFNEPDIRGVIPEPPTEPETEPVTEAPTEPETEPVPEAPTEPETEPVTEAPTEPETEPATEAPTEPETEPVTEAPTEPETEPATEAPTEPETEPETEAPTEPETEPETEAPTEPETEPVTEAPTEPEKYDVIHEYYTDNDLDGTVPGGEIEPGIDVEKQTEYNGEDYVYTSTIVDEENKTITVIYNREILIVEIPEEDVPLVDIPEEDVPLVEIPDEDVPLADVPKTGDPMAIYMALSILSGMGLAALGFKKKEN